MTARSFSRSLRTGAVALGLAAAVGCGLGVAPASAAQPTIQAAVTDPTDPHFNGSVGVNGSEVAPATIEIPAATASGYLVAQDATSQGFVWVQTTDAHGFGLKSDGSLVYFGGKLPQSNLGGQAVPGQLLVYKAASDTKFYQFTVRATPVTLGEAYKSIGKAYPGATAPAAATPAKTAAPTAAATAPAAKAAPAPKAPAATQAASAAGGASAGQGTTATQQSTASQPAELAHTGATTQQMLLAAAGAGAVVLGAVLVLVRRRLSAQG